MILVNIVYDISPIDSKMMNDSSEIKQTVLHSLHVDAGAKMVPFAGYDMPVSYPMGIIKEHMHTRENAGLFDVSHMGQIFCIRL